MQGHIHLAANAAEVGRACTDLLGHVMTTVSNFWPFAAAAAASSLPAGSTLNPNARSFTPFVLNPNAKEFTPKQSKGQMHKGHKSQKCSTEGLMKGQKCSTPDMRLDPPPPSDESCVRTPDNVVGLKPVAERKCTPYVKTHPVSPEVPSDVSAASLNGCESKEEGSYESDGGDEICGGSVIAEDPGFDG